MKDQIDQIRPMMELETYGSGDTIMVEGTANDRIRFILDGRVAVIKKGFTLAEIGEGNFFGEMEVLDVMPSVATIKALVNTTVMAISNRGLRKIYKADATIFSLIIMNLARDLSRRLRRMDEHFTVSDLERKPQG
ncbi:MAG: cyclic nucleotide-binding domain-containing protein [Treponema sp.]|nr:cyclic nucleotide-binding domain-containing protein [Treponema sp.]